MAGTIFIKGVESVLVMFGPTVISLIANMAKYARLPWDVILGAEIARAYKPQPQA